MAHSIRLLVNAEPFGFGPTAAIADFFPYLRDKFEHIAFIGGDHCLDLHSTLNYDAIYDITNKTVSGNSFKKIVSEYDLFFTASNFRRALIAHSRGVPTIVYDPLSWYWPSIPDPVGREIFYIAQDFYGVREVLQSDPVRFQNVKVVPPIIPRATLVDHRELVLINLGGIQNPIWSLETATDYARTMIAAIKQSIPKEENLIIATSKSIAKNLDDQQVQTYTREDLTQFFPKTKYAIMTPGLANIHTAACYDIPTFFLPPANDSQGLQLDAIRKNGLLDAAIDWSDIFPDRGFGYKGNQEVSMHSINHAFLSLKDSKNMSAFTSLCFEAMQKVSTLKRSSLSKLILIFGNGGAEYVADAVSTYAEKLISSRQNIAQSSVCN